MSAVRTGRTGAKLEAEGITNAVIREPLNLFSVTAERVVATRPESVRRVGVPAAADYILSNAPAEKSTISSPVWPNHSLGYDAGDDGQDRSAWWRRVVQDRLEASGGRYRNGVGWVAGRGNEFVTAG